MYVSFKTMHNKAMERKLDKGEAIDISSVGDPHPVFPGVWIMEDFLNDIDYCDAETERWIYSIGKHKFDGKYYAAVDNRFYENPLFECVWLR